MVVGRADADETSLFEVTVRYFILVVKTKLELNPETVSASKLPAEEDMEKNDFPIFDENDQ